MQVLPSPVGMRLMAWRDDGPAVGWHPLIAVLTRFLPAPGEFLDIGRDQRFEVRHLGADVAVGGDQLLVYGALVEGPPR